MRYLKTHSGNKISTQINVSKIVHALVHLVHALVHLKFKKETGPE